MKQVENSTEEQLIIELQALRQRVAELEELKSKLKQENEALKEHDVKLNSIFSSLTDLVFVLDKEGRFTEFYIPSEELCLPPEEFIGKKHSEVMPSYVNKLFTPAFNKNKRGQVAEYEYRLDINGQTRWYSVKLSPIALNGDFSGSVAVIRNITQQRQAEQRYKAVIQSAVEGFCLSDLDGNFIDINDSFCYMLGYSRDELLSMKIQDIDVGYIEGLKDFAERILRVKRTGGISGEEQYKCKDGRIIDVLVSLKYLDAGPGFLSYFHRDITEQKKLYQQLEESEERYRAIFENTGTATAIVEEDMKFSLVNTEWEKLFGYSKEEVEGKKSWAEFVCKDDLDRLREHQRLRRVDPNTTPRHHEFRIVDREGKIKSVLATVGIIPGTKRLIASLIDTTECKRAKEEKVRYLDKLHKLTARLQTVREEERKRMACRIHDELGQSLTALKMDLSWLAERIPLEKKSLVHKSESIIKMLDMTIQTVKGIAVELRPRLLDDLGLTAAIEWQAHEFQRATGIKCKLTSNPKRIIGDQDVNIELFRIFQELLTNVFRHAEATQVKVSLEERNDRLKLQVEDNGRGITKDQISAPESFGLLGVKERVNSMGGKININGSQGKGTLITVSVPLSKKETDQY